MPHPSERIESVRVDCEQGRWEMALRGPVAPLRPFVRRYCLYQEERLLASTHQHLPHRDVTLIISLGGVLEVRDPSGALQGFDAGQGFLAGIHTQRALTDSGPRQRGVEVSLTPLGAHRLLGGLPMHAVSNRSVALEDLLGAAAGRLAARLDEARSEAESFAVLDGFFSERILGSARPRPCQAMAYAWYSLAASRGTLRIGALAAELGWSRKRLGLAFRSSVGHTPKTTARVLRFDHAMERLKAQPPLRWSELALACGYHDQAHLSHEVRELSGSTLGELARRLVPGAGALTAG